MPYYQRLPCTNIALIPVRDQGTPDNQSRRLHRSDFECDDTNDFRILIISSCQQDIGVGTGETSFNPTMGNSPRVHQTPPIEALRNFVSSLSVVNYILRQQPTIHIASNLERPISHSTYMPNINPQHKRVLTTSLRRTQNTHSHNIVEPIVVPIASLEHDAKLQAARRLRRPRSLQQNVRAVVRAEVVASVGAEDACLGVRDSPVCT